MISLTTLWLPIVLSAVAVFIASSIIHMALPYHKSDYSKLPSEEKVMDALRAEGLAPGRLYHFPHCASHKEMGSPEMQEKYKKGPIGLLTILPSGVPAMGSFLAKWFLYCVAIG
ncbi:MAG: hypothetical protein ACRD2Y_09460, partial [Terriglobales bacterium]